jgi:plastocyanin
MAATKPTQYTPQPDREETVIHVVTSSTDERIHNTVQHPYAPVPNNVSTNQLRITFVVMFLFVLAVGAFTISSGNSPAPSRGVASFVTSAPGEVSITPTGFVPATVSIKVGQAVTWTNTDTAPHIVASDPYPTDTTLSGLNSQQDLSTNDRYSFVFDKAGTYTYHDDLNPYTLEGTVIVKQ